MSNCIVQFQFHKGSIQTKGMTQQDLADLLFQFHKGSIQTLMVRVVKYVVLLISIP